MPMRIRGKSFTPDGREHGAHAVVPAVPAMRPHADRPQRKVDLVVDHEQLRAREAQAAQLGRHRRAALVVVRARPGEVQRPSVDLDRRAATPACRARGGGRGRAARRSTHHAPTLWRVSLYSRPGLPRPTTSRGRSAFLRAQRPRGAGFLLRVRCLGRPALRGEALAETGEAAAEAHAAIVGRCRAYVDLAVQRGRARRRTTAGPRRGLRAARPCRSSHRPGRPRGSLGRRAPPRRAIRR